MGDCQTNVTDLATYAEITLVGIAYAMPCQVRKFQLFHVCMCIVDDTPDSNKEGCPLVTVFSKDS
jgi:hypothetical protein